MRCTAPPTWLTSSWFAAACALRHSWRTTNNTLLYDVLPEATRTRLFGHTAAVNRGHYTAVTSTEAVVAAAASLLQGDKADVTASDGMSQETTGYDG